MSMGAFVDVLAIDGPAGAGKSTVARAAATRLGTTVLDTGAMYRAVTLACLRAGVAIDDAASCASLAESLQIDQRGPQTCLDGEDISEQIRTPEVTAAVSIVAAHALVRDVMVRHQRAWARTRQSGVVEGRDIGTVVFPDARLKIFLVASDAERARRRHGDEAAAGRAADVEDLEAAMRTRDALDSGREVSPLRAADDAVTVDTTGRSIADVVDEIVRRFEAS
jgi:cytidylate kinase